MKGVILAGGSGTRLSPITKAISKQLVPVYDKPMIYYPLTTLLEAEMREILIITQPRHVAHFQNLLGDGAQLGCSFAYEASDSIRGTADSLVIAERFLDGDDAALILGDTLLHGPELETVFHQCTKPEGVTVIAREVDDPRRYGVVSFAEHSDLVTSIEEKPSEPKSTYALTGVAFCNNSAVRIAETVEPSIRGEHELPDVYKAYLEEGRLHAKRLSEATAWFDTGTIASLTEASDFVEDVVSRGGQVGCPEETAWRNGLISDSQLYDLGHKLSTTEYGQYLMSLVAG